MRLKINITVFVLALVVVSTARAEEPTPQAINANAAFLAYPATPPPVAPVKVCVVDTGVDLNTDVAGAVVERWAEDGGTLDDTGSSGLPKHGTYVAGVIASQLDGRGSVGIWPQARIVSDRVFVGGSAGTSVFAYLKALERCHDRGAKVANLSLSGLGTATGPELAQLENQINDLRTNGGMNIVAAAGNNGGEVGYPARFPSVFGVAANDSAGSLCDFSSRGPTVDISTLGCSLTLSMPGHDIGLGSGTSYSAPVVSGVIAALRAYRPELTAAAAERLLTDSARVMGAGKVLDATAAFRAAGLDAVVTTPVPAPAAPATPSALEQVVHVIDHSSKIGASSAPRPLEELGVRRPKVRSSGYTHGVLRVVVAGVPDFGRAIFVVDGRRYVRPSGRLRVRLKRAPRRATVAIDVPDVGRTAAIRVLVRARQPRR